MQAPQQEIASRPLIDSINILLPQTQCGQCGYQGCKPYAQAIASGQADINQCPPGGEAGIRALAGLMGLTPKPLNHKYGVNKPKQLAFIVEDDCIGCVKCLAACPVDAIVGAAKMMHTVIATECTGCELCLAPCPVDCIVMQPLIEEPSNELKIQQKFIAMLRYENRNQRKAAQAQEKAEKLRNQKAALLKMRSHNNPY
jgi:Na+-translocating ferredoxin:NAD+ oxidoreductase subunit B